ncbi:putative ABC transporter permease [Faecalicatena sp. AGMB00832]|uniref:ABC transporter permease n=1 Tax=Faecalicatena faecalis TaxID=2726362 RepID=A0ABS6D3A8_9FIRM|nr:putative ABC transporter permease [Faecalicatena faecalis]MBU3875697.1 putative ABC transporter permease [Faecalicatena faecalis]
MKQIVKYIVLFLVGGAIYALCELAFRGYTFKAMAFVGGICFILCGLVNEFMDWKTPLQIQMLICAIIITAIEFVAGLILNVWLNLDMWDYSNMKFNVMGQICPQFFTAWFALALPAITLDDFIRWKFFSEEKPRYQFTFPKDNFECAALGMNGICKRYLEKCEYRYCKSRNKCGECKNYMFPADQKPCKNCKHVRR